MIKQDLVLLQQQKTRKISEILRTTKYRQIMGKLTDGEGGYCANGVLMKELVGRASSIDVDEYRKYIPLHICNHLIRMNDVGKTFEECADYLERVGY